MQALLARLHATPPASKRDPAQTLFILEQDYYRLPNELQEHIQVYAAKIPYRVGSHIKIVLSKGRIEELAARWPAEFGVLVLVGQEGGEQ